jgi:hypothetical protein
MSGGSRPSASSVPGARADYEFSDGDRDSIRALAASVSFVGVCLMLLGVLSGVFALGAVYAGFVPSGLGLVAGAAVSILVAWWMMSAGRSLSALVATRGRDVEHLMGAVAQLRRLFGFARVAVIVFALLGAAFAGTIFWCTFAADKGGRCFAGW